MQALKSLHHETRKLSRLYTLFFLIIYLVDYLDILKKTLRAGGNVLLPVDTAGRILELILMLESVSTRKDLHLYSLFLSLFLNVHACIDIRSCRLQYWADENLNYPIYFLTYVASSTIDYVKSFLEWMSDSIAKSFEQTRENIFLLK